MESLYEMFIFRKEDRFLNNIDPRVKFLTLIILMTPVFLTLNPLFYIALFMFLLFQTFMFANSRRIFFSLKGIVKLLAMFFIVIYIFNAYPNFLNLEAAYLSFISIFRFFLLVYMFTLFFTTTYIDDLAQALYKLKIPYPIAYALVLSVRFVPTVAKDIIHIYDAQRSRGLELDRGGFFERLRKMLPILIPAFVISILRVNFVAEALETRAFGFSPKRTFMTELKLRKHDIVYIFLTFTYILVTHNLIEGKIPFLTWM